MNVLIVDTSAWISYFKVKHFQHEKDLETALKEGRVYIPAIAVAELLSGCRGKKAISSVEKLLRELPLPDQSIDHWVRVGKLRATLARKGLCISTPDAHVAQSCLDLDGYLLSEDNIFKQIAKYTQLRMLA